MDLIVQVAASNKLSPAGYTLIAMNEETGRPIQYKASQSVGSLGVTDVELISKKAEKERRSQPAVKPLPDFQVRIQLGHDFWSFVSKDLYLVITLNLINLHVLAGCPLRSPRPRNGQETMSCMVTNVHNLFLFQQG